MKEFKEDQMVYIFDDSGNFVGIFDQDNVFEFHELPAELQDDILTLSK